MKRKDPKLADKYKKNLAEEEFIKRLNNILEPFEELEYADVDEQFPTLQIIGAPRSGTTLLSQVLCSYLDIGYINNLSATFWKAPVFGIKLANKLIGNKPVCSFDSDFGRTSGLYEPHEFGYFWFSMLGYEEALQKPPEHEQSIDWVRLRRVLTNMTKACDKPMMFKSFLLGWHISKMQEILPKTCFIRIRRDPLQNAASLLKLRKGLLGSVEEWASLKPAEYSWLKDEPYWKQVAGQIYYIEKSMTEQIELVGRRNVIDITYEEFCKNPYNLLVQTKEMLEQNGAKVDITSKPEPFETRLEADNLSKQDLRLLTGAISEFYSSN